MGDSDFFWIENGDLVLSGQFAWEGAVALARSQDAGCVASHRYHILRGRLRYAASAVLLAFFRSQFGGLLLDQHSRGAAGRNRPLNIRSLLKEKVPVLAPSVQERITDIVHLEARVADTVQHTIQAVYDYRARLIADVVTGKVDVREAAARLPEEVSTEDAQDNVDVEIDADATDEEVAV